MEPTLKPQAMKRLKLKSDESLSGFGFKFKLRRYMTGAVEGFSMEEFSGMLVGSHGLPIVYLCELMHVPADRAAGQTPHNVFVTNFVTRGYAIFLA